MTTTAKLGIPFISGQQAQPEVTHNQAVMMLQAMALGAKAIQNAPPGAPADGDVYIVGTAPTGAWATHPNRLAIFLGGWHFLPGVDSDGALLPMDATVNGLSVFLQSAGVRYVWLNPNWEPEAAPVSGGGGGATDLAGLSDVNVAESPAEDGYVLTWDDASGFWIAAPVAAASSGGSGPVALSELTDVDVDEGTLPDGYVLTWDDASGKWVGAPGGGSDPSSGEMPNSLSDLIDVDIAGAQNGDVLRFDEVTGKWVAEPEVVESSGELVEAAHAFSVYLSSAQAIADGVYNTVLFDTESEDPFNIYNPATGRATPNKAGLWCFFGGFQGDTGTTLGYVVEKLRKNGVDLVASAFGGIAALPTLSNECFAQVLVRMNGTTDYMDMQAYVTGTGGSNHVRGGTQTFFGGFWVGK